MLLRVNARYQESWWIRSLADDAKQGTKPVSFSFPEEEEEGGGEEDEVK